MPSSLSLCSLASSDSLMPTEPELVQNLLPLVSPRFPCAFYRLHLALVAPSTLNLNQSLGKGSPDQQY